MGRLYSIRGPASGSETRSLEDRRIDINETLADVVFTAT